MNDALAGPKPKQADACHQRQEEQAKHPLMSGQHRNEEVAVRIRLTCGGRQQDGGHPRRKAGAPVAEAGELVALRRKLDIPPPPKWGINE
jgi:hypothetical protein